MTWFGRRWRRMEREFDDEIRVHLQLQIADYIKEGMSPEEARRRAAIESGGASQIKEECREVWLRIALEQLWQDLRYALRRLRKNPGFTAVAALSLAVGIGANTGIFSVTDALLLKELPVRSPDQLVSFRLNNEVRFSYPVFERFRDHVPAMAGIAAMDSIERFNLSVRGREGETPIGYVRVALVTGSYFSTLGVSVASGRNLTQEDDRAGAEHLAAVISDGAWRRWFEKSPNVLGRTMTVGAAVLTVVGVAPAGFTGDWMGHPVDLWAPIALQPLVEPENPQRLKNRRASAVRIVARLDSAADRSRIQAAAEVLNQQAMREDAGPNPRPSTVQYLARQHIAIDSDAKGYSPQRALMHQPLAILIAVVALVLLIACANVATLLLARSAARRREVAMRLALGASRFRVVRQLLAESILLSLIGGTFGLLFARWGTDLLARMIATAPAQMVSSDSTALVLDLRPDLRAMLFTTALCIITGTLFGLAPALRISRASLAPDLNQGSLRAPLRVGGAMVVAQVAISVLLLIGAGLFVQSLQNLKAQDLGFERQHVTLVWADPFKAGIRNLALASLFERATGRLSAIPGVRSVAASTNGVLGGRFNINAYRIHVEGQPPKAPENQDFPRWSMLAPGFFDAVGAKLIAGRDFNIRDNAQGARVAIIDEGMARNSFPGLNPIGRHIGLKRDPGFPIEIVGVVKSIKYTHPGEKEDEAGWLFLPYRQNTNDLFQMCMAVRTAGDVRGLAGRIRAELRAVDRNLPVLAVVSTEQQLDDSLVVERLIATLAGFFALVALALACLGLYGLLAYATARRTGEIGIRFALGATRAGVLRMVFQESLLLAAAGIAIGVPSALAVTRLVANRMFGIGANDPLTILGAISVIILVAALAGFIPAFRASKVNPAVALRYE